MTAEWEKRGWERDGRERKRLSWGWGVVVGEIVGGPSSSSSFTLLLGDIWRKMQMSGKQRDCMIVQTVTQTQLPQQPHRSVWLNG